MKQANDSNNRDLIQSSSKAQKIIFSALICAVFLLIFILNKLFPLYSDDYLYSFVYNSDPLVPINSFYDIFHSQMIHYQNWGGRSIVHAIAQFLLWIGVEWGDALNSLAYIVYVLIIYKISNKNHIVNPLLFIIIASVLWIFLPVPVGTVLWITGSANYLWGTLIVLLFLYPYYSYYRSEKYNESIWRCICFFVFGIIAGWTNENIFVAQVFFISCLFFLYRKEKLKIPVWAIVGLIGVCIGGIIMLAAPGNFIRSEVVNETLGLTDKSLIDNILYRFGKLLYRYLVYILPLVLIYLTILFLYLKKTNKEKINKKQIQLSLLFFVSGHVAWIVMCASSIFPPRATFGIITFMIIAIGILYSDMNFAKNIYKYINILVSVFLIGTFIFLYTVQYKDIRTISFVFKEREAYIRQQKAEDKKDIIFYEKITLPERYSFDDLSDDPHTGYNRSYADYYGIDSVRVIQKK